MCQNSSPITESVIICLLTTSSCILPFLRTRFMSAVSVWCPASVICRNGVRPGGYSWTPQRQNWSGSRTSLRRLSLADSTLTIDSVVPQPTDVVRDLGVLLDSELSLKQHVNRTANTCFYHLLPFTINLRQLKRHVNVDVMKRLISAFVFSQLDYCNGILSGLLLATIAPLQRVQNAAARLVLGAIMCVLPWRSCTGCQWCTESSSSWHWWCSQSTHISAQTTLPILYTSTATTIRHAIGSARRPAPATLFHVRGRNLATELSLWLGQSYGTVCQRQFVMRTVYALLNADSGRTFLACVLMIDSVVPFRSGFVHGGH